MSEKLNDIIKQLQAQGNQNGSASNTPKDAPVFKSKLILEDALPSFGMRTENFSEKGKNNKKN